jgi:hypothetical protein
MTNAQKEMIQRALARSEDPGMISPYSGIQQRSLEMMTKEGLIERDFMVRDPKARESLEELRDSEIRKAHVDLNDWAQSRTTASWKAAHAKLEHAYALQGKLSAAYYWVTEKGRAAVQPEVAK